MQGLIHSLESFSTVDGPGIRFVVFLQGCPMHCKFCHNPDTWAAKAGKEMTVEEIMAQIRDAKPFFRGKGGVTVSGGEPMLQPKFVRELFYQCRKEGIHTAVETSGFCPQQALDMVLEYTDLVIFSLKAFRSETLERLTLANNEIVLKNLKYIDSKNIPLWLQYLVIPNFNDSPGEIQELSDFIKTLHSVEKLELLPYHRLGIHKWKELGLSYELSHVNPPSKEDLAKISKMLGIQNITRIA